MVNEKSFISTFDGSYWNHINKETIVPHFDKVPKKNQFLKNLYNQLSKRTYVPSPPREFIVINKHNHVSRFIPTFRREDNCVYYFCVKSLENDIAVNRVPGTFGGFRLGNPLRDKEDDELSYMEYVLTGAYNKHGWKKNWKDFQRKAYQYSLIDDYRYIIKFDIANFYDAINLQLLQNKVRLATNKENTSIVNLLFYFLQNWNKSIEDYFPKTMGLPQDEIGDCSRILSNFYLQDYDRQVVEECHKYGCKFLRYADDQIIYAKNEQIAKYLLVKAAQFLFKINLNINSAKVLHFKNRIEFNQYWAFSIFDLLENSEIEKKNQAAKMYFEWKEKKIYFRESSVLKRFLSYDLKIFEPNMRHKILSIVLDQDFLATSDWWYFKRISENVDDIDEFCELLKKLVFNIEFNSFHYNVLKFYKKIHRNQDNDLLINRIDSLRLTHSEY